MPFDLRSVRQCENLEHSFKANLYTSVYHASTKTGWTRLSGLPVGVVSGLSTIVTRICSIFECLIKGFANMGGAMLCIKSCNFKLGLRQATVGTLKNFVHLPFSIASAGKGLVTKTFEIAKDPSGYASLKAHSHDPDWAGKYTNSLIQKKRQENQKAFAALNQSLAKNPNDANVITALADCYWEGKGVAQDQQKGFELYDKAALLGNVKAMRMTGEIHLEIKTEDAAQKAECEKIAFEWTKKAAEAGDFRAMTNLASHYMKGQGTEPNSSEAFNLFNRAIQNGDAKAHFVIGLMYLTGKNAEVARDLNKAVPYLRFAALSGIKEAYAPLAALLQDHQELQTNEFEHMGWLGKTNIMEVATWKLEINKPVAATV